MDPLAPLPLLKLAPETRTRLPRPPRGLQQCGPHPGSTLGELPQLHQLILQLPDASLRSRLLLLRVSDLGVKSRVAELREQLSLHRARRSKPYTRDLTAARTSRLDARPDGGMDWRDLRA